MAGRNNCNYILSDLTLNTRVVPAVVQPRPVIFKMCRVSFIGSHVQDHFIETVNALLYSQGG